MKEKGILTPSENSSLFEGFVRFVVRVDEHAANADDARDTEPGTIQGI
jgi:hypothetical protein